MFFAEARIAAKLRHRNIVAIAGFGQVDGVHCLAMEYVFGASLSQALRASARARRPLSVGALLSITASVCDALDYAHRCEDDGRSLGIVHRDVTPQNILIGFNGVPKLTDFGIAKATGRGWETQAGIVKGKFSYMSPEQALGGTVDRRSDIFGVGIVLWEALTGQDLFKGSTPMEVLAAVRSQAIAAPSKVVDGLTAVVDPIVSTALERSPKKRFASAAEMASAIRQLIDEAGARIDDQAISKELAAIYGEQIGRCALALRAAMAGRQDLGSLAELLGAQTLDGRHLPRVDRRLQNPDPLGLQPQLSQDLDPRSFASWDESTAMNVPTDDLLSLISADEATEGQMPAEFAQRFGPALDTRSDEVIVPDARSVGDELRPRPLSADDDEASPLDVPQMAYGADAVLSPSMPERPILRAPSLDLEESNTPRPALEFALTPEEVDFAAKTPAPPPPTNQDPERATTDEAWDRAPPHGARAPVVSPSSIAAPAMTPTTSADPPPSDLDFRMPPSGLRLSPAAAVLWAALLVGLGLGLGYIVFAP